MIQIAAATSAEPPRIAPPRPAPRDTPLEVQKLPPAKFDNTLTIGGDEVKARQVETRLSVDVHVNGSGPYKFIVDSGADTSAVGMRIARGLELPLGTPALLNGMTSRDIVDRVRVAQLSVGTNSIRDLELPALREADVGGDGMIGIDALAEQRLMLDFEQKTIRIEDARMPEKHEPGEILIIARRERGQLILTHVQASGLPLDAVIDTGTQVTVGNLALRDKLLRGKGTSFVTTPMIGVTGHSIQIQFARIDELQLGPVTFHDVMIAFADLPPFKLFGLADEPALLLGTDLLEKFRRVSLDFRARRVRFQLRKCDTMVAVSTDPSFFSRMSANAEACQD